jgi:hypothetical protein
MKINLPTSSYCAIEIETINDWFSNAEFVRTELNVPGRTASECSDIIENALTAASKLKGKPRYQLLDMLLDYINLAPPTDAKNYLECVAAYAVMDQIHDDYFWNHFLDSVYENRNNISTEDILDHIKTITLAIGRYAISKESETKIFNKIIDTLWALSTVPGLRVTEGMTPLWLNIYARMLFLVTGENEPKLITLARNNPIQACKRLQLVISGHFLASELNTDSLASPDSSVAWHPAVKQQYNQSCGAACLLCAAFELGIETTSLPHDLLPEIETHPKLALTPWWEKIIYSITAANNKEPLSGPSPLDKLVEAAKLLRLCIRIYEYKTSYSGDYAGDYDEQRNELLKTGIDINSWPSPDFELKEGEIEMVLVSATNSSNSFHWVLCRRDNTVMDSADGKNIDLKILLEERKFVKVGISFLLSKG